MPRTPNVRTTVDLPAPVYAKLKAQAAAQGCSLRDLLLRGVETVLLEPQRPKKRRVKLPIINSSGPKVHLTNKRLYELIEFP